MQKTTNILLLIFTIICFAPLPAHSQNTVSAAEIYRIKIENKQDGTVSVKEIGSPTWEIAGRVIYPCHNVNNKGFTATKWATVGAVCASAVNAIHIKTGDNTPEDRGIVFSIVPKDMLNPPEYYNSFLSPDSSIYTDIPAGESIFGGGFSPFVGNPVSYIDLKGEPHPVRSGYVPKIGETIIIKTLEPLIFPTAIIFENRFGGKVTVDYGGEKKVVVGEVLKPVGGIGRFSGTQFIGSGRIRANHTGVIDISTSPLGKTGGFQIIPSAHGMSPEMSNARLLTQWMVVGPTSISGVSLEGHMPLFSNYLQPRFMPMDLDSPRFIDDLLARFIVDVRLEGSDEWQPMPRLWVDPDMSKPLPQWVFSALKNVTHIRILFPIEE